MHAGEYCSNTYTDFARHGHAAESDDTVLFASVEFSPDRDEAGGEAALQRSAAVPAQLWVALQDSLAALEAGTAPCAEAPALAPSREALRELLQRHLAQEAADCALAAALHAAQQEHAAALQRELQLVRSELDMRAHRAQGEQEVRSRRS